MAIGKRILVYALKHDSKLPQSLQELNDFGLLSVADADFMEPERGVRVIRQYRPVPTTSLPADLIIMIESYDPPPGAPECRFNVLMLDGRVYACNELVEIIEKDSGIRRANGLVEFPYQ